MGTPSNTPYWLKEDYAGNTFYFRQNHDYYPPMIADIRVPINTVRLYQADPVPHTRSTKKPPHTFFDPTFGETFYLFGWDYTQQPSSGNPKLVQGWAMFMEGSAQMLLDFNAHSSAVINTDYRLGGGFSGRGLPGSWLSCCDEHLSWKIKYFHESTHLGDEYSLSAEEKFLNGDPAFQDFRRINVSYEAAEFFLALDDWKPAQFGDIEYKRVYGGYRRLNDPGYTTDDPPSLTTDINNNEFQIGGEVYMRLERTIGLNPANTRIFYRPQFIVLAMDAYQREQYDYKGDLDNPVQWSFNTVAGVIYGDPFMGENSLRYFLNYYVGLHPHGQFRNSKAHFWGINASLDFK